MGACFRKTIPSEIPQNKTAHSNFNTDKSTFYTDHKNRLWKVHIENNKYETTCIYHNNLSVSKLAPHSNLLRPTSVIRQNTKTVLLCMPIGKTDLFSIIAKSFNWKFIKTELRALSLAIRYLHDNGIAHRDIKPENVVLYRGHLCLIDFDFAGPLDEKIHCGTTYFKCPQGVSTTWDCSDSEFSRRCDVYAFGKLILAVFWQASAHGMIRHRRFIFDAFHSDFMKVEQHPFTGSWGKWASIAIRCISKVPPSSIPVTAEASTLTTEGLRTPDTVLEVVNADHSFT